MSEPAPAADGAQGRQAALLGVWSFLVTEMLFFGGLFAAYTVYRSLYPGAFAQSAGRLDLALGAGNTLILITSSWTMALAVRAGEDGRRGRCSLLLACTLILGSAFLAVKGLEYGHKVEEGLFPGPRFLPQAEAGSRLFFALYFVMTGLHALHIAAGIAVLAPLALWVRRPGALPRLQNFVEGAGLYWHFVDIVWIFLFPTLYLMRGPA